MSGFVRVWYSPECPFYDDIGGYVCQDHVRIVLYVRFFGAYVRFAPISMRHMSVLSGIAQMTKRHVRFVILCPHMGGRAYRAKRTYPKYGHFWGVVDLKVADRAETDTTGKSPQAGEIPPNRSLITQK